MDFLINSAELDALYGLPHHQQLAYLKGIRPYMDVQTGLVGIKRGISYQSIAEQLYIEPYQGVKSESFSRAQARRAVASLERVGLLTVRSQGMQLILKCELATRGYSVQNKPVTKPSQQADTVKTHLPLEDKGLLEGSTQKPDTGKTAKADTPLIRDIYIYLLLQFEQFWNAYPEKKSKQSAWEAFQKLNPDDALFIKIIQALHAEIKHREIKQATGSWVPPWKYPANWLAQRCFEDELTLDAPQERRHATRKQPTGNKESKDLFWNPRDTDDERSQNNVIQFQRS
jgi:ubiquitin